MKAIILSVKEELTLSMQGVRVGVLVVGDITLKTLGLTLYASRLVGVLALLTIREVTM